MQKLWVIVRYQAHFFLCGSQHKTTVICQTHCIALNRLILNSHSSRCKHYTYQFYLLGSGGHLNLWPKIVKIQHQCEWIFKNSFVWLTTKKNWFLTNFGFNYCQSNIGFVKCGGKMVLTFGYIQWLSELIECGNLQIGKPAVALWIPMTPKWLISHLKVLNVGFNLRYQTLQKW